MEITGTFKHRKIDLVTEGFDPARLSDPIYFLDPAKDRYTPLDGAAFDRLKHGDIRL
jgi:fatty-acyl-CoA synthase